MSFEPADQFAADYRSARERFLRAAERRGAALSAYAIEPRGARGEELSVDVAYVGPREPGILLVVSSGLHGVEGFAGSAIQHQLLTAQLDDLALPRAAGLLLVHALNPFGFATLRRDVDPNASEPSLACGRARPVRSLSSICGSPPSLIVARAQLLPALGMSGADPRRERLAPDGANSEAGQPR